MKNELELIMDYVSSYVGYLPEDLKGRSHKPIYTIPRHLFFYFSRNYTRLTYREIGEFTNRNHATVVHGANNVRDLIETDSFIKQDVENLEKIIEEKFC